MAIDYDKAMASKLEGVEFTYGDRETMLYALSVGMGRAWRWGAISESTAPRSCMGNNA